MIRRPSRAKAHRAIVAFLAAELGCDTSAVPPFEMIPDGDAASGRGKCGWAFTVLDGDTTSYVHEDLRIEWYGTAYDADPPWSLIDGWTMPTPPAGMEAIVFLSGMYIGAFWVPTGMDDPAWCAGNHGSPPWPFDGCDPGDPSTIPPSEAFEALGFRVLS